MTKAITDGLAADDFMLARLMEADRAEEDGERWEALALRRFAAVCGGHGFTLGVVVDDAHWIITGACGRNDIVLTEFTPLSFASLMQTEVCFRWYWRWRPAEGWETRRDDDRQWWRVSAPPPKVKAAIEAVVRRILKAARKG